MRRSGLGAAAKPRRLGSDHAGLGAVRRRRHVLLAGLGRRNVVPIPSIADALYLSFYPAVYVGLGLLLRARVGRLPAGLWLDGVIGGLAVAALGAAVVFGEVLSATHGAALTVATNLAYPLADLLLLGLLVGIMAVTGFDLRGEWLLIALAFSSSRSPIRSTSSRPRTTPTPPMACSMSPGRRPWRSSRSQRGDVRPASPGRASRAGVFPAAVVGGSWSAWRWSSMTTITV